MRSLDPIVRVFLYLSPALRTVERCGWLRTRHPLGQLVLRFSLGAQILLRNDPRSRTCSKIRLSDDPFVAIICKHGYRVGHVTAQRLPHPPSLAHVLWTVCKHGYRVGHVTASPARHIRLACSLLALFGDGFEDVWLVCGH